MSHPFGDLIKHHLSRKHGLSQNKLADGIDQDAAVVSHMCRGQRLTGPQARGRVLAIIRWFNEQGALDSVEEANGLLDAAGLARLNADDPEEMQMLDRLEKAIPQSASGERQGIVSRQPDTRWRQMVWLILITTTVIFAVIGFAVWKSKRSELLVAWQEDFDPLQQIRWMQAHTSAMWEDIPGPSAVLRENDPNEYFGKVESEVITVDVDTFPILRVKVEAVDPEASYSVQILDKRTGVSKVILTEIEYPGEQTVNVAQEMDWQGSQVFTINVWISGEDKSATFSLISIESD